MGLWETFTGKVVLDYQVKTEQAKIALRELTGEQKANAKAAIQGMEDQKAAHERMVKGITVGLGIAAGAVALGIQGFKAYEERIRLSAATAGASMDGLRKASHGLLTDLELMQVAAEGMNGRFKLSSTEMETVLAAAVALEAKGIAPLGEAAHKLGEAVKKGEIDPLKELGIAYDENLAKTDKRGAALKALTALSQESGGAVDAEAEAIRQSGVAFKNSMAMVEESIGRIVVAFGPMITAVADLAAQVAVLADAASHIPGIRLPGGLSVGGVAKFFGRAGLSPLMWNVDAARGLAAGFSDTSGSGDASYLGSALGASGYQSQWRTGDSGGDGGVGVLGSSSGYTGPLGIGGKGFPGAKPVKTIKRGGGGGGGLADGTGGRRRGGGMGDLIARYNVLGEYVSGAEDFILNGIGDAAGLAGDALSSLGEKVPTEAGKPGPTWMEKTFGPPEQFDLYKDAFQGFTDAASAGYTALVTGSESAGKAMKRVIAQSIMAEGQHMLIRALREAAEAIAALAHGNLPKAGTHALAAAKFGAGAAIAGVVAHSLGAGGATGSAGASAGGATGGARASNDNAPRNTTVVLGHGWDDETPRQRAAKLARANRQAASYEAPPSGVSYQ